MRSRLDHRDKAAKNVAKEREMEALLIFAILFAIWKFVSWWRRQEQAERVEREVFRVRMDAVDSEYNLSAKKEFASKNLEISNLINTYIERINSIPIPNNDDILQFRGGEISKIKAMISNLPNISEIYGAIRPYHYEKQNRIAFQAKENFENAITKILEMNVAFIKLHASEHFSLLFRRMNQQVIINDFGVEDKTKWHRYLSEEFLTRLLGYDLGKNDEAIQVFCLQIDSLLHERAAEIAKDKIARLADGSSIDDEEPVDINDLSPQEYERHCAALLEAAGWTCTLTAASGDQGVDVIAEKNGVRIVLQCKLYSQPVGNSAVQEAIAGKIFEKADIAAVVSNATFTKSAKALASNADVLLLHHDELDNIDDLIEGMSMDKSG